MIPFARNVRTGLVISPVTADRRDNFVCIDCAEPLTLRRGDVRAPHFAHRPLLETIRNCRINQATSKESVEHMTAKILLARDLERFSFRRVCMNCATETTGDWRSLILANTTRDYIEELIDGFELEHRFGSRVVDAMREFVVHGFRDSASHFCFAIEIRKTHAVDTMKFEELRNNDEIGGICEVLAQQVLDASQTPTCEVQDLLPWTCGCESRVSPVPVIEDDCDGPWFPCMFCDGKRNHHSCIQGSFIGKRPARYLRNEYPDVVYVCNECLEGHVGNEYNACVDGKLPFFIVQGCRFRAECIWKQD